VALHQQLSDPLVRHRPHQRHPPLQPMLSHYPLKQGALGAVAADQELQQQRWAGGKGGGVMTDKAGRQTVWHGR
jgi:hypothetical protein